MQRLLILATYFPDAAHPSRGNWALEQARAFAAAGLEVTVIVPNSWIPRIAGALVPRLRRLGGSAGMVREERLAIHYLNWPYYPWHAFNRINRKSPEKLLLLAWRFLKWRITPIMDGFQPDAVLAHHTLVCGQLAYRINRRWGTPYVITDHEVGDLIACRSNPAIRDLFRKIGQSARAMTVVSDAMRRIGESNVDGVPFHTVHNGSSYPPLERVFNDDPAAPVRVFCCAKFYGRKDIPLLIEAFDAVVGRRANAVLRVGGDGPDRRIVEECHARASNPDKIKLLGMLGTEQVREEMEQADLFALVGWAEPFGVVFLEAMACALPVVVSADAGVAEVLEDGVTAVFTQPRDHASVEAALERLIGDPHLRQRIGQAGQRLFLEKFQWSSVVRHYIQLLEGSGTEKRKGATS